MKMLYNINKRNRLLLLLMGLLLSSALMYRLSWAKTLALQHTNAELQQQQQQAEDAPKQMEQLTQRLQQMRQRISHTQPSGLVQQTDVFNSISLACARHQLVVRRFPMSTFTRSNDLNIETIEFTIAGSFKQVLTFLHDMEQALQVGKVASVHFVLNRDLKTQNTALHTTVFLQLIHQE